MYVNKSETYQNLENTGTLQFLHYTDLCKTYHLLTHQTPLMLFGLTVKFLTCARIYTDK